MSYGKGPKCGYIWSKFSTLTLYVTSLFFTNFDHTVLKIIPCCYMEVDFSVKVFIRRVVVEYNPMLTKIFEFI